MNKQKLMESLIRSTRTLIEAWPQGIILNRPPEPVDDGAGGVRVPDGPDTQLPVQTLYFAESDAETDVERTTLAGTKVVITHVLVGMPDADMRENDWFVVGDKKFKIQYVLPDRDYQTKGEVTYEGRA